MFIIDAHQHFWKYSLEDHGWINEEMAVLKRDFLPKDLQEIYKNNNVAGCIAVQADQSETETDFLLELAAGNDFIKGVVGWIDLRAENIEERLEYYSGYPKLKGFRHVVQSEPDVNFMLDNKFQHGLNCLENHGFTYDVLIFPTQMEAALQTIKKNPNLKFVIDHIAKPYIKKGETPGWEKYMREMAACPNVYCKISGMVTEADWKNWVYEDFTPWLDVVFDAFGADRIMFGSDWPVCLLGGNFEKIKGIVDRYLEPFSEEDKAKVWGGNTARFYSIQ